MLIEHFPCEQNIQNITLLTASIKRRKANNYFNQIKKAYMIRILYVVSVGFMLVD